MKYFIIGDEDTVLGFSMVGVKGKIVIDEREAKDAFNLAINDSDIGIVIITERTANLIRPIVNKYLFTEKFPLIVEIPDRIGALKDRPGIRKIVNEAIGIKL